MCTVQDVRYLMFVVSALCGVVIVCGMIRGWYTLTTTMNHYLVFLEGKWLTDTTDVLVEHI